MVLGRASAGSGDIDVASQVATLEIAEPFFTMAFEKSAAELGQQADVIVRIAKQRDFAGAATAELLGLPAKTSTDPQPQTFTQDTKDLVFKVKIEPDSHPGKFETLVCRAIVTINGEPITHTFGGGELRIDEPLPPKADAPPPPTATDARTGRDGSSEETADASRTVAAAEAATGWRGLPRARNRQLHTDPSNQSIHEPTELIGRRRRFL